MNAAARRVVDYLGLGPEDINPSRRGWMARASSPQYATKRRDRWIGCATYTFLIIVAVAALFRGRWFWYLAGGFDLLIAVPLLVRCLRSIIRRDPLAGSPHRAADRGDLV